MKKILIALSILISTASHAADISVGDVAVSIPNPSEFSPVTQEMSLLHEFLKQFVMPPNEEFVSFIPEEDVVAALKGDLSRLSRRFAVQTAKSLVTASVNTASFDELKDLVKTQNDEAIRRVEAQLPDWTARINQGIAQEYDVDLALSISQMLSMPVHEDTNRTIAYSMLVKYDVKDGDGNPVRFVSAVTLTYVHVKGKILFLYAFAEESGLQWGRTASKQWADAVVAANPSDVGASLREALPSPLDRIDWGKAALNGIAGAFVGLLVYLISQVINRRNKSR